MTRDDLQDTVDRLAIVSTQRALLSGAAVAAAIVASIVASAAGGGVNGVVALLVAIATMVAVARPDSHVATVVVTAVVIQWLAGVDDHASPAVIVVALALYAVHSVVALLAVTPISVTIDRAVLVRWGMRSSAVAAATVWAWLTVAALDTRDLAGNVALTGGALLVLAALLFVARARAADG